MTQRTGRGPAGTGLEGIWQVLDAQVASGRIPGYVAGVRVGGQSEVRAGGRTAVEAESAPMTGPLDGFGDFWAAVAAAA